MQPKRIKHGCRSVFHGELVWFSRWMGLLPGEAVACTGYLELLHQQMDFAIAVREASLEVNPFISRGDQAIAEEIFNYAAAEFPLAA